MKGDKVVKLAKERTYFLLFFFLWNRYILIVQIVFVEITDCTIPASHKQLNKPSVPR